MTPVEKLGGAAPVVIGHVESAESNPIKSNLQRALPQIHVLINKSTVTLNMNLTERLVHILFYSLLSLAGPTPPSLLCSPSGPKVTYCHQLLPCCQSSSSNTLALSAQ